VVIAPRPGSPIAKHNRTEGFDVLITDHAIAIFCARETDPAVLNETMAKFMPDTLTGGLHVGELDLKRHGGRMNVAFFDGYVQAYKINANDLAHVGLTLGFPGTH
jgi:prepilin-type processing-associated H-X9-DG protein